MDCSHSIEISKKFAGKYIAIVDNKVVAYGLRTSEVVAIVNKVKPGKEPVIMKVPPKGLSI